MRKTKTQRGITLIALIITIVVLLILAVVAINSVTGDGIIQHATNAKAEYEKAQDEENKTLSYYQTYLDAGGQVGKWIKEGNTIKKLNGDGSIDTLKIGDIVNYDNNTGKDHIADAEKTEIADEQKFTASNYQSGWKVLGVENGNVLLVSADVIKTDAGNEFCIMNHNLYIYGEELLKNICAIYKNDTYAQSARSMNVEDVNKITGYKPEGKSYDSGYMFGDEILYQYNGNYITFTVNGGTSEQVYTSIDESGNKELYNKSFMYYIKGTEWLTELDEGESLKIINDGYTYFGANMEGYYSQGMSTDSEEYKVIFRNTDDSGNLRYYLASKTTRVELSRTSYRWYGLRHVTKGAVSALYVANYQELSPSSSSKGVRAVVTLKSDVQFEKAEDNTYTISIAN